MPDQPEPQLLDDAGVAALLPVRAPRDHKGSNGKLVVVAGSLDYAGAALLAAHAAVRAGAGLVTLAVPASLQALFSARVLEVTTFALPELAPRIVDPDAAADEIRGREYDALVLGPGLLAGEATVRLVVRLLATGPPAVVDAEGLNSLATTERWWEAVGRSCVLTPHPGEFARLRPTGGGRDLSGDDDARGEEARNAAREWGQTVVLKGARSVVAEASGRLARAPFENPALATAGTGDVLAGTTGALLAQGLTPFDAARAGVYLHGMAGDGARERFGDAGVAASDLPEEVALSRRRLTALRERLSSNRRVGFTLSGDER